VDGVRPRGRPKRTWREVVQKDCQARKLNRDEVIDHSRWWKLTKDSCNQNRCESVNVSSGTGSPR